MDQDLNAIKVPITIQKANELKEQKITNKIKTGENSDVQLTEEITQYNITNNNYAIKPSDEQLKSLLGIAHNDILDEFKEKLKKESLPMIEKSLKEITPLFIATHLNNEFLEQQKYILLDLNKEKSIRKQALIKINLITHEDASLLGVINWFHNLHLTVSPGFTNPAKNEDSVIEIIYYVIKKIKQKIIIHEKKYGKIYFNKFENLLINSLVKNNPNFAIPLLELTCKFFVNYAFDKSKNEEYLLDHKKITENREKWTNWFSVQNYSYSKKITDLLNEICEVNELIPSFSYYNKHHKGSGHLYWMLSDLGLYIIEALEKSDYKYI